MAGLIAQPPSHPPIVHPGTVLHLTNSQWKYGNGPLTLRVDRDRPDLSHYYADQIWVQGWRLDDAGVPIEWTQALIPIEVIWRQSGEAQ